MASKYQIIVGMAEHTARDITQNPDNWMSFLPTETTPAREPSHLPLRRLKRREIPPVPHRPEA